MNFDGFDFDDNIKQTFNTLDIQGRVPHAVVIESRDSEKAMNLAVSLSIVSNVTRQTIRHTPTLNMLNFQMTENKIQLSR